MNTLPTKSNVFILWIFNILIFLWYNVIFFQYIYPNIHIESTGLERLDIIELEEDWIFIYFALHTVTIVLIIYLVLKVLRNYFKNKSTELIFDKSLIGMLLGTIFYCFLFVQFFRFIIQ